MSARVSFAEHSVKIARDFRERAAPAEPVNTVASLAGGFAQQDHGGVFAGRLRPGGEQQRRARAVVFVEQAGGEQARALLAGAMHGRDLGFQHGGNLLRAHGAVAQDARASGARHIEHGGLHADHAVAAVEDVRDARAETLADMFGRCRTDVGEGVGARRGQRHAGELEQPPCERMRRRAERDGPTAGGHDAGHAVFFGQHQRERTGPEGARELARRVVELCEFFRVGQVQHMHDERVVCRPALGAEDGPAGFGIQGVGRETVNRLGWDGDQTAVAQHTGEPAQGGGSGAVEAGLHSGR